MYYQKPTYFSHDVPVSVTMDDDAKATGTGDGNGNGNEMSSDASLQEQNVARLLQVRMAPGETEEKQEIGGNINRGFPNPTSSPPNEPNEPEASRADAPGAISGATSTTNSTDEDFVLQPPSEALGDKGLEMQIERDLGDLSEMERRQVYFDMRGEIFKSEPRAASDSTSQIDSTYLADDSSVSQTELESLNRELLHLLENPEEQLKKPVYQNIRKTLTSSGSDFYANSIGFRTKLLRAECKDVGKAARRTADYLALLWESFGETLLSRPIRLSDLSPTERQLQRKGFQQLFRFRDQSQYRQRQSQELKTSSDQQQQLQELDSGAGRRIAGSFDLCRCVNTTEPAIDDDPAKIRVLLYLMQVASDDEETRSQGIVFIFMLALRAVLNTPILEAKPPATQTTTEAATLPRRESDKLFENDSTSDTDNRLLEQLQFSPFERSNQHNHTRSRVRVLSKVFRGGPVRVSAIHVCAPSRPELQQLKSDLLMALNRQERVRTKFHNGTSMECSLSLNKVGIPTDRLPLKYDGTIKTEDHLQWIAIQEAKELAAKQKRPFDIVECPMNMDILSGRGQLVRSHPGNVSFRKDFIRARSARYDMAANREEKNTIADDILEDISILKRKFLKQHQGAGYWTELDKKTAKEKVMMAFREFRKSQRNQQQQQIRKVRSQPGLQQSSSHPHHQPRPSLPLSQSLPHSPVTQPQRQLDSRSQPPPLSLTQKTIHGPGDEGAQPRQSQSRQQQGDMHFQLYPPSSSSSAVGPPGEAMHHPQHHIAGIPPPPLSYYLPHPPIPPHLLGYGHPIPPHLLPPPPPPHHLSYPPHIHDDQANSGNNPPSDAPGIDRPESAAAAMGYMRPSSLSQLPPSVPHNALASYQQHHPGYPPAMNPEFGHTSGGGEIDRGHVGHPPSRRRNDDDDEGDDDPNERMYKRFRTM